MAAVVLLGHGDDDRYVYREDVPVPAPAAGEVLVAVEACSVNNTDVNVRADWYAGEVDESGLRFPRIQGADVAGRIAEAGPGVDPARVGERVICDPSLRTGAERLPERAAATGLLGFDVDGGFAEYVAVPAVNAWRVPEDMPAPELAAYPVAYSTALEMLLRSRVRAGGRILITGAGGGVGAALVQLATVLHIRAVAIASAPKAARIRDLGAELVIDRGAPSMLDSLRSAGADAVDGVADVVGGARVGELVELVRPGGTVVTCGAIGGPIASVDLRHLIYKDVDLRGVARVRVSTFAMLVDLIHAAALRPVIAATYPLRELVTAQRAFMRKQHVGKIVVTVPSA